MIMLTTTVPSANLASTRLMSSQLHNNNNNTINKTLIFFNPLNISHFSKNGSLRYLMNDASWRRVLQTNNNSKMDFAIYCGGTDKRGDLIPFGSTLNSWKAWMLGGVLGVILPLFRKNWAPSLLKWTKSLEMAEEKIEEIAEAVEKIGEEVEKVTEEIEEKLPDGGKLKSVVNSVENMAKIAVRDADKIEQLIDKVENVEKKVEAIIEAADEVDKSSVAAN